MPTLEGKLGCVLGSPKKRNDYVFIFAFAFAFAFIKGLPFYADPRGKVRLRTRIAKEEE